MLPVPSSIEDEDYEREEFNFTLKRDHNIIQLDIINDSVLEPTEYFFVQISLLETSSRINLNTSLVQIYILDDECKLVNVRCHKSILCISVTEIGFESAHLTVPEGNVILMLNITSSLPGPSDGLVQLSTRDGSATGLILERPAVMLINVLPGLDYNGTHGSIPVVFQPGQTIATFDIQIHDDNISEGSEEFFGVIQPTPGKNDFHFNISIAKVSVEIEDDDSTLDSLHCVCSLLLL